MEKEAYRTTTFYILKVTVEAEEAIKKLLEEHADRYNIWIGKIHFLPVSKGYLYVQAMTSEDVETLISLTRSSLSIHRRVKLLKKKRLQLVAGMRYVLNIKTGKYERVTTTKDIVIEIPNSIDNYEMYKLVTYKPKEPVLEVGDTIEVIGGPLMGATGEIVEDTDDCYKIQLYDVPTIIPIKIDKSDVKLVKKKI